jgi:hypothetical protein
MQDPRCRIRDAGSRTGAREFCFPIFASGVIPGIAKKRQDALDSEGSGFPRMLKGPCRCFWERA